MFDSVPSPVPVLPVAPRQPRFQVILVDGQMQLDVYAEGVTVAEITAYMHQLAVRVVEKQGLGTVLKTKAALEAEIHRAEVAQQYPGVNIWAVPSGGGGILHLSDAVPADVIEMLEQDWHKIGKDVPTPGVIWVPCDYFLDPVAFKAKYLAP